MTNTDFRTNVEALLDQLQNTVGHDAATAALLATLRETVVRKMYVLAIESRVNEAVAENFDFDFAETSDRPFTSFADLLDNALARVGRAFEILRASGVKPKDADYEYLVAKVTDAVEGAYNGDAARCKVLSRAEAQEVRDAEADMSVVALAQKVLSANGSRIPRSPQDIAALLDEKRDALALTKAIVDTYDPAEEEAFQADRAHRRAIEQTRLAQFRATGKKDPDVVVSPVFTHYEDQILLQLSHLEARTISDAHRRHEKVCAEVEALTLEIAELEAELSADEATVTSSVNATSAAQEA